MGARFLQELAQGFERKLARFGILSAERVEHFRRKVWSHHQVAREGDMIGHRDGDRVHGSGMRDAQRPPEELRFLDHRDDVGTVIEAAGERRHG